MDFVHDQLVTGRKIRVLTIVDTFSRFSPATDPRFSYHGEDVVQTLERVCRKIGYPKSIRVDHGCEFISRDLDLWAYQENVILDYSRPVAPQRMLACATEGKVTDNAFIESFNGKFQAECSNTHWFMSLNHARSKMEEWLRDYNEVRLHSATGNNPPISLINGSDIQQAPSASTLGKSPTGWSEQGSSSTLRYPNNRGVPLQKGRLNAKFGLFNQL